MQHISEKSGFSIVEAMVAVGILGVAVSINANFLSSHLKSQRSRDLMTNRDILIDQLQVAIMNPENIRASALLTTASLGNQYLAACIDPTQVCPAAATNPDTQQPIQLVNIRYSSGSQAFDTIAGTAVSPRVYNTNLGNIIGTPGFKFPYAVTAYFWATCPMNMVTSLPLTSCNGASVLNFRFQINPSHVDIPSSVQYPKDSLFNAAGRRYAFSQQIDVKDVNLVIQQSCAAGSVGDGYNAVGKIQCRCIVRQIGTNPDGTPICDGATCAANQKMMGIINGLPDCQPTTSTPSCYTGGSPSSSNTIDCGAGYWLTDINVGTCVADENNKKYSGTAISCSGDSYRCCTTY